MANRMNWNTGIQSISSSTFPLSISRGSSASIRSRGPVRLIRLLPLA